MNIKFIVYRTIHKSSKKEYIGIHKQIGEGFDGYLGSGILLKRAIEKYGEEDFYRETLFSFDSIKEARIKEKELVDVKYVLREDTYNISLGGTGGNTILGYDEEVKNEIKIKISESFKKTMRERRELYNGKCFDEKEIIKYRQRSLKRIQEHPHTIPKNKGRIHTEVALENYKNAGEEKRGKYIFITDGEITKLFNLFLGDTIPDGWYRGRGNDTPKFKKHNEAAKEKISNHPNIRGVVCYTNGEINIKLKKDENPPKGFWKGMKQNHDFIWITNGVDNRRNPKNSEIPEGFTRGRTIKTRT